MTDRFEAVIRGWDERDAEQVRKAARRAALLAAGAGEWVDREGLIHHPGCHADDYNGGEVEAVENRRGCPTNWPRSAP